MKTERSLATIQTIAQVTPIENADRIVRVSFVSNNWQCVMQKTEAIVGAKVVYFEIDSVLPAESRFAFMEQRKYRVKTVRLKKEISQGLAMGLSNFPELTEDQKTEGKDLTDFLSVVKYEKPVSGLNEDLKGAFPGFISKTDEVRAQNIRDLPTLLAQHDFWASIKLDGTPSTFYLREDEFGLCSRNLELKPEGDNLVCRMNKKYGIETRLRRLNRNLAIQGEIVGPGIQSNRAGLEEVQLFIFTGQDLDRNVRLLPNELCCLISELNVLDLVDKRKIQNIPHFCIFRRGDLSSYQEVMEVTQGSNLITPTKREGLVFRSATNRHVSFQVIDPEYLLSHRS